MSTTGYTILILIAAVAFWSAWRQVKAAAIYDRQEEMDYACFQALEQELIDLHCAAEGAHPYVFNPERQSSSH
jgi:ABC-type nickel/cobalt efflux system permease component RcnA